MTDPVKSAVRVSDNIFSGWFVGDRAPCSGGVEIYFLGTRLKQQSFRTSLNWSDAKARSISFSCEYTATSSYSSSYLANSSIVIMLKVHSVFR